METMLEGLGQGVLSFDRHGICAPIFSRRTLELLHTDPSHKPIWQVLGLDSERERNFKSLLNMLFTNATALGFEDLIDLAPKMFAYEGQATVSLVYRPMLDATGNLSQVLVIATDRTRELDAEERLRQKEIRALRTIRIAKNRNYFVDFVQQFRRTFQDEDGNAICWMSEEQAKRDIHTIKGLAGVFQLVELENALNIMEADIANLTDQNCNPTDIHAVFLRHEDTLWEEFNQAYRVAAEVLGDKFEQTGQSVSLSTVQLYHFAEKLKMVAAHGATPEQLHQKFLESLVAIPLSHLLSDMDMQLQELASRFDKQLLPTRFTGENLALLPDIYQPLFSTFTHLARNIIDHGIEEPKMRIAFGKPSAGQVTIHSERLVSDPSGWFRLVIKDDGRGIDTDALRIKLRKTMKKEVVSSLTDDQVVQYIFEDSMSTLEKVTALSGQGVGMSAIKAEVLRLGGTIWVENTEGDGIRVHMDIPILWHAPDGQPPAANPLPFSPFTCDLG